MAGNSKWTLGLTTDIKASDFLFAQHKMPPCSTKLSPPPRSALQKLSELAKDTIDSKNKNGVNGNNKNRPILGAKSRYATAKNKTTLRSLNTGESLITTVVSKMTTIPEDTKGKDSTKK